jgi:hypothetical protein
VIENVIPEEVKPRLFQDVVMKHMILEDVTFETTLLNYFEKVLMDPSVFIQFQD